MMSEQKKKKTGKFMSLVLRHNPGKIGIELDEQGWADVKDLLGGLAQKGHAISFAQLDEIVATNDKQRYRFNADKTKVCANQGHSLSLDLPLQLTEPPAMLYHGTASRFMKSIMANGLQKQNRHHVHLSAEKETALNVGMRHGVPVLLLVEAYAMFQAGYEFYLAENGVWLVTHVPAKYLKQQ